jgi:hypothetical protein
VNWSLILSIAVPVLVAAFSLFASAFVGRHAGKAAIMRATTDVKQAQDANWAAYTEQQRLDNEGLRKDNKDLRDRIDAAEAASAQRMTETDALGRRRLEAAQLDYTRQLESVQAEAAERLAALHKDMTLVEKRLGDAEVRARAGEVRASKAEELYWLAVVWMRNLFAWAREHLPGVELPPPPPELERDL